MATCTQCGAELKPGTKFCENCGAKVSVRSLPCAAAQPAAVPSPPGSADPGCTAAPTACTDASQPQARAAIPMQQRTCRPAAPDLNAANLYAGNVRHTAQTGAGAPLYAETPRPRPHRRHAAAGGTGGNLRHVSAAKLPRPRAPIMS